VIYTTNAIESLNSQLRKIIKTRGHFPSDDAASKLLWLALRNITADWTRSVLGMATGHEPVRHCLRRTRLPTRLNRMPRTQKY
jgi:transposase-like protein